MTSENDVFPVSHTRGGEQGNVPGNAAPDDAKDLYLDVAALLDRGLPDPPAPVLLRRTDGNAIFYRAQVNLIFGDPESGKTLVAQAAASEALRAGRRVLFVDIDHNGPQATVCRFIDMGVPEETLRDLALFRYVEPEDKPHLKAVIADAKTWRPAVAVVDSVGELLPLLGLSSNSPDDFTAAHTDALKPLAMAGACVLAIDHLPKNIESRASGPTGTAAKRRAIGGVSIRVTVNEQFTPGRGGSAWLAINKDRHGGLRRNCPAEGKEPLAGLFKIEPGDDEIRWSVNAAQVGDAAKADGVSDEDVAALDALDPPPSSVRDARSRLGWRTDRAADAMRVWRSQRSRSVSGERETLPETRFPFPTPDVGNGKHPAEPAA